MEEVLFKPHPKAKSVRWEGWLRKGKNLKYKNHTWPGRPLLINMSIFTPWVHNGSGFLCLLAKNIVFVFLVKCILYIYVMKYIYIKYIAGHHTYSCSTGEAEAGALLWVWGRLELFHKRRDGRGREERAYIILPQRMSANWAHTPKASLENLLSLNVSHCPLGTLSFMRNRLNSLVPAFFHLELRPIYTLPRGEKFVHSLCWCHCVTAQTSFTHPTVRCRPLLPLKLATWK